MESSTETVGFRSEYSRAIGPSVKKWKYGTPHALVIMKSVSTLPEEAGKVEWVFSLRQNVSKNLNVGQTRRLLSNGLSGINRQCCSLNGTIFSKKKRALGHTPVLKKGYVGHLITHPTELYQGLKSLTEDYHDNLQ